MEPIYAKHLNDNEFKILKRNLNKGGYKFIGRSKDRYDNYYTSYERKSKYSTDSCEVINRVTITRLNEYGKDNNTYKR